MQQAFHRGLNSASSRRNEPVLRVPPLRKNVNDTQLSWRGAFACAEYLQLAAYLAARTSSIAVSTGSGAA